MKISLILASRIGAIGKEVAGTEGVYLEDLQFLKRAFKVKAFARFKLTNPKIAKIYFPLILIRIGRRLKRVLKLNVFEELFAFIAEFIYIFSIFIKSNDSEMFIGYSSTLVALLPTKKRVVFLHTYDRFFFPNLFHKQYETTSYIFCSKYLMNYFIRKYKFISKDNSFLLYNAVNKKDFFPLNRKVKQKNAIRLLYVSAWVKQKGLHILLSALHDLPSKVKNKISLTIASSQNLWYVEKFDKDNKYIEKINTLISKNQKIELLNGVKRKFMNNLYNNHDFLIFPSTWNEPCSLSLIESVFAGLPVVAFNVGGNGEILSEKNSILLESKSQKLLTKTLAGISNRSFFPRNNLLSEKNYEMSSKVRTPKLINLIKEINSS